MWASLVVVSDILLENAAQKPLVYDPQGGSFQDLIETLSANGAAPAFREGMRLRSLIGILPPVPRSADELVG